MAGIASKPLTVDVHEPGFVSVVNRENQVGPWYTLSDQERRQVGVPWGPANPQALNRYSYVLNGPTRWTDPGGHARRCNTVGCGGVVHNKSSQDIIVHGERRNEGCRSNDDVCFESVSVVVHPGESSTDYGFVDADFIGATDNDHPLAGRGTDWRLHIGDYSEATVVDDGQGGTKVLIDAPKWTWIIGKAVKWEHIPLPKPEKRPKCVWVPTRPLGSSEVQSCEK